MCTSPSVPALPPAPPPAQPLKNPMQTPQQAQNRTSSKMGGGTLLTGPTGISNAQTARTTLLGQ